MEERATLREPTDLRGHGIPILARLARTSPNLRIAGYVIAVAGTALVTIAFLPIRDNITPLSKGFAYLAVVVAAAATGSLGPGIVASVLGFLCFNYFFLPPYGRWTIARPEYVAVLFAFLALSVIISELLARAAERARTAEAREAELRTIQELSRELTTRVPGEDTIEVALLTVKQAFGYESRGAVRRADRGRSRPGPAGDGRRTAGIRVGDVGSPVAGAAARATPAVRRRTDARARRPEGRPAAAHARREPRPPRVLRSARPGARARPAPALRDGGRGLPADRERAPLAARRGVARPPQPARRDQGVGDGSARRGPGDDGDRPARGARGDRWRDRPAERVDRQPAGHVEDPGGLAPGPAADGGSDRDGDGIGRPAAAPARASSPSTCGSRPRRRWCEPTPCSWIGS